MHKNLALRIKDLIDNSPSVYHVAKNCSDILLEHGYTKLDFQNDWEIQRGGKYFVKRTNSTIVAFTVGQNIKLSNGFKIFASHSDSPGFRIKPNPLMLTNGIVRLNTEVYGGPIINTWFDRPLSIAGRVIIKGEEIFKPKTLKVQIKEPILTIPNLAIHQNREVNNGVKIDRQNDSLPVLDLINSNLEKEDYLLNILAKELNINKEDILDFDLYLYLTEKGCLVGLNQDMLSIPKLDNLASVYTGILAMIESKHKDDRLNVFVAFDNEEIGSATKQGADSNYLSNILERIMYSLNYTRKEYLLSLANSYILSVDGAHGAHPAYLHKSDPTNLGKLNEGVSIKINANQRYTSDGYSIAILKQLIKDEDIKIQYFVNNSNEVGGSTIGPISSTHLDIDSIDIGIPMLAMHSSREICGIKDLYYLKNIGKSFFGK